MSRYDRALEIAAIVLSIGLLLAFSRSAPPNETPVVVTPVVTPVAAEHTLLVFSAEWCQNCLVAKPHVARLIARGIKVTQIDADANPDEMKKYSVTALPTFILDVGRRNELRTNSIDEIEAALQAT